MEAFLRILYSAYDHREVPQEGEKSGRSDDGTHRAGTG
jgi:hypothetical protein